MRTRPDIVVDSALGRTILLVECKRSKDSSPEVAARLRQGLLADSALPAEDDAFFMMAFPNVIYLWVPGSAPGAPPSHSAPAKSVLREYLGRIADQPGGPREESLELAIASWLSDLTANLRGPAKTSEADQMLVVSGLYDKMRGAYVRTEFGT